MSDIQQSMDSVGFLPGIADVQRDIEAGLNPESTLGDYTGERIFLKAPELYKLISRMVFEGMSDAAISRVLKVHERTAAMVRRREVGSMSHEDYSRALAANLRVAGLGITDEVVRRVSEGKLKHTPLKELAYTMDKLENHNRLIAGAPTEIVETIEAKGADPEMRKLWTQKPVLEAEVVEPIHSRGEKEARMREAQSGENEGLEAATDESES